MKIFRIVSAVTAEVTEVAGATDTINTEMILIIVAISGGFTLASKAIENIKYGSRRRRRRR